MKRFAAGAASAVAVVVAATPGVATAGVTVYAGPNLVKKPAGVSAQADALAFFPSKLTIRAGQSVTWQFRGFHTATFPGTMTTVPFVTPRPDIPQPTTKDAAGNTFWWSGRAPSLSIDPFAVLRQGGPTISSPADVRSSGLLRIVSAPPNTPPAPYTLRFSKPGTYHYLCVVHPGMRGTVRVVAKAKPAKPAAVRKSAATQLKLVVRQWKQLGAQQPPTQQQVWVGAGARSGAEIAAFFPTQISATVGDTVTFVNHDPTDIHTVTFGPEEYAGAIEKDFLQMIGNPPIPVINPLGALPSEPPGSPMPVAYDGTNHGNGYLNSGILAPSSDPAGPGQFAVRFTRAGTFRLECVIHANMDATVVVR